MCRGCVDVQHPQRYAALLRRLFQGPRVDAAVQAQQRVVVAHGVVQRAAVRQPEVRRAATRHGGGCEARHRIRGSGLAVVGDQRRMVVEVPEVQAAAAVLVDIEVVQRLPGLRTRTRALLVLRLDVRRHALALLLQRQRMVHRELRHLLGDRLALGLVAGQHRLGAPAFHARRDLPRQVHRIGDAGVHAVTRHRYPQVRRIAADEDAPVSKPVRHQTAANPVLLGQYLVLEIGAHAQDGADGPVAVDRIEVGFVRVQVVVQQPGLAPVDRIHIAATPRIERKRGPGRLVAQQPEQGRRAKVGRLHPAHHGRALQRGADPAAHQGTPAVATDQVLATDAHRLTAVQIDTGGPCMALVLGDLVDAGAVQDAHTGAGQGVCEQHRLKEDLVDAVRRLGRGPVGVGAAAGGVAVLPRGYRNARQLNAGHGGAVGDVVRIVCRQAAVAQGGRHAEAAEDLHRPGRHMVALDVRRLAPVPDLGHQHGDTAPRQVHGQRQPDRPRANHQHRCLQCLRHACAPSKATPPQGTGQRPRNPG